jgi:hypothetical protein
MRKLFFVSLYLLSSLVFVGQADAYIDPGTGSMMVQALIAAIAAASVTIGIFWNRVRSFFSRWFGSKKD